LAVTGVLCVEAPFWAIPPVLVRGTAAAAGFAFINAVGTGLGGLAGPWVVGLFRESASDYSAAMAALAFAPAVTAAIVLTLGRSMISPVARAPNASVIEPSV
jgi:ACS family tartrate transporter-like MFS transporter